MEFLNELWHNQTNTVFGAGLSIDTRNVGNLY